jgi:hypothetical protein
MVTMHVLSKTKYKTIIPIQLQYTQTCLFIKMGIHPKRVELNNQNI